MSALSQQDILSSVRDLGELDATREIGRRATSAIEIGDALEGIASLVLRMSGIRGVRIELAHDLARMAKTSLGWGVENDPGPGGRAIEKIVVGGRYGGELRLDFDLRTLTVESPIRFTRFVAEQIAGMLHRWDLERRRDALVESVERLRSGLATRKAVERAKGILARSQDISESDALARLRRESRDSGLSLREVADSVISGEASLTGSAGVPR